MNTSLEPIPAPAARNIKPLWVAVGVLAAAVVALGGTLIYTQTRPATSAAQVAGVDPASASTAAPDAAGTPPASPPPATAVVTAPPLAVQADGSTQKQPIAPVESGYIAPKKVVQPPQRQVAAMSPAPGEPGYVVQAPPPRPAHPVCHVCGTVESVTPVERQGRATGLGAVGGGVVGALVGNQFGGGNGRTVATILGAVGGGFAGNAIEKNVRKTTVYEIAIRMDDGKVRHLERRAPVAAGTRVTLQGNTLRMAGGAQAEPVPAAPTPAPAPAGAGPYYTRG